MTIYDWFELLERVDRTCDMLQKRTGTKLSADEKIRVYKTLEDTYDSGDRERN